MSSQIKKKKIRDAEKFKQLHDTHIVFTAPTLEELRLAIECQRVKKIPRRGQHPCGLPKNRSTTDQVTYLSQTVKDALDNRNILSTVYVVLKAHMTRCGEIAPKLNARVCGNMFMGYGHLRTNVFARSNLE
ncbi:hypothetical protein CEXT_324871 [Caerostris extrusa]|uniref:Uncharacterized protein n=1 Tax=Caerostris extrusa TaxID=172846 RepID=A0AAV4TW85_CAEEX|nr:hypothetical protein CEXT_324871 [Caerostris extrusa]